MFVFVGFCSFSRRIIDVKGEEKGRGRTFVEIVFFAASWVTGVHVVVVHDDGDVLILGGEGREVKGSKSEIQKKKRLGASDNGKEKKSILIPCRSFVGSISHAQPRTATPLENGKMRWRNLTLHFGQVTSKSLLSFSFLNNNNTNNTTTTNNNLTMADALEEAGETGGGASLAKDLFSGAVGGIAQVLIGKM